MKTKQEIDILMQWKSDLETKVEKYEKAIEEFEIKGYELSVKEGVARSANKNIDVNKDLFSGRIINPISSEIESLKSKKKVFNVDDVEVEIWCIKVLLKEINEDIRKWQEESK